MSISNIKIPEKVYVGFQGRRSVDEVPLGFMTPYTDDDAGLKRRNTVDSWARGYGREKTFNSVHLDNLPMVGFKIGRSVRRSGGWSGSGASYVRIEDPRGFELEITIENLVMCMNTCIVEKGELMMECVWGRTGNRNILLPIESEPYRNSVTTTAKISAALSLRDVKAGDEVKLITGETGIYLGSLVPIENNTSSGRITVGAGVKRYVLKTIKDGETIFWGKTGIKVAEITKPAATKLTPIEIETMILEQLKINPMCCENDSYSSGYIIFFATSPAFTRGNSSVLEMTEDDVKKVLDFYSGDRYSYREIVAVSATKKLRINQNEFTPARRHLAKTYYTVPPGHYSYSSNRTAHTTTGFLGKQFTGWGTSYYYCGEDDHIDDADVLHFHMRKDEIITKTGLTFEYYL